MGGRGEGEGGGREREREERERERTERERDRENRGIDSATEDDKALLRVTDVGLFALFFSVLIWRGAGN